MTAFIFRRLAGGVLLVFVVTALTFVLLFASGTNIALNLLGDNATPGQIEAKKAELGLDRPVIVQYISWLGSALRGDLGRSYFTPETVSGALIQRLPVTLSLVIVALLLIIVLSVVLGVLAVRRRGAIDNVLQSVSVLGFALPSYWIGLVLVVLVALPFPRGFAATGFIPLQVSVTGWLSTIVLPAVALAIGGTAAVSQQIRGALLDVLGMDYIRTLRSRGIGATAIFYRHALRNAAGPALTILSLHFIGMLGGAVVIEKVFALPGLGTLATSASMLGDVPMVMGIVAVMAVIVVVVNLLVDILQGVLNPKARINV